MLPERILNFVRDTELKSLKNVKKKKDLRRRYDTTETFNEISLNFLELFFTRKRRFKSNCSPYYFVSFRGQKVVTSITNFGQKNAFYLHA